MIPSRLRSSFLTSGFVLVLAGCFHGPDASGYIDAQFHSAQPRMESSYQGFYSKTESTEADFEAAIGADTDDVKANPKYAQIVARHQPVVDRVKRTIGKHDELLTWIASVQKATQDDYQRMMGDYQTLQTELNNEYSQLYGLNSEHTNLLNQVSARGGR